MDDVTSIPVRLVIYSQNKGSINLVFPLISYVNDAFYNELKTRKLLEVIKI